MIDLVEAHALCSKSESNLIETSFAPDLEAVPLSALESKLSGVKKLHQRCIGMIDLLHSDSRIATTRRKIELFAEAIQRFEGALDHARNGQGNVPLSAKDPDVGIAREAPSPNPGTQHGRDDRQLQSRDRRILEARREQVGSKSGSTRTQSHVGSIPRRQQGRRSSSKNH